MLQLFKESSKFKGRCIILTAAIQKAINSQLQWNKSTQYKCNVA